MKRWTVLAALTLSVGAFAESGGDLTPTGVSTEAIQLPKPAGTIQGFGGEASSVGNTGSASYSVQIEVPKGRNGLQPALSLNYSSSNGEGVFGMGWSLDLPMIERSNLRGVPQYLPTDLMNSSADGELVDLGSGQYRPLIDKSQSLYFYEPAQGVWTRYEGNGIVHTFGGTADSRVETASGTYKWLISSTVDPFNNRIDYTYVQDRGQTYLSKVIFGAGLYSIQFGYEERPDALVSYSGTQAIQTALRCKEIWVRSNALIRHYQLQYDQTSSGKLSRLRKVLLFGKDDITRYPDLSFSYSEDATWTGLQSQALTFNTSGSKAIPPSLSNPRVNLLDLNSDGITDIIETSGAGAHVWLGNGDGTFKPSYAIPELRGELGSKNTKLLDVNGDRQVDFIGSGQNPMYWPGDGHGGFSAPQAITSFPRYSVGSSQVRTFDVNGDGKMDLVAQEADELWTFFNGGDGRWDHRVRIKAGDPGTPYPAFKFSSAKTYFADMNGDGLSDIVYVDRGKVYYYPNRGNGYWDEPVTMTFEGVNYPVDCPTAGSCPNPPQILELAHRFKDVFLVDINSDGLNDLMVVLPNDIAFAFNRGDGTFGVTQVLQNVHASPMDVVNANVTVADMNGNGTQDVVWSNGVGEFRYLDLNAALKPNLLVEIRNGLGKHTVLEYLPHTKYAPSALVTPGEFTLPFVVHTVKSIKVYSWDDLVNETQFSYFGGHYVGAKNEFRGFRLIERYQPGDDSVPDLLDRRYFELGKALAHDKERGLMTAQEIRKITLGRKQRHWGLLSEGALMKGEQTSYQTLSTGVGVYGETAGLALEQTKTRIEGDDLGGQRAYDTVTTYTLSNGAILTQSTLTKDDQGSPYRLVVDSFAQGIVLDGTNPVRWNVTNLYQRDVKTPAGQVLQSTRFYFDGQALGTVLRGKITAQYKLQGTTYVLKNRYAWTADGNLSYFEDAAAHRTTITYEPTYRLYPKQVANAAGHIQKANFDWDRGVMTSSQDANANWSFYFYDPFLRLNKVIGPVKTWGDGDLAHPTLEVVYNFGDENGTPSTILTKKLTDIGETTTTDSMAYFDALGRSLGTVMSGPTGKFIHTGGSEYNIRGKVKKKYLPFFVNSLADWQPNTSRPFIRTEFDVLDRETQVFNPEHTSASPSVKTMLYRVGETDTTDELGKLTKNYTDFLGRLTKITNAKNNDTLYGYDQRNLLTQITDSQGSQTLFQYDSIGRRTCKLDPNLGKSTYTYNNLDLLTQKQDYGWMSGITSCSQTPAVTPKSTTYTYADTLNRITQMAFANPATAPVGYSYDTGLNGIGRLTGTTFQAGSKTLAYDNFGNVTRTDNVIDGQSFRVEEKFDVQGRLREVDYPAVGGVTLRVGYEYNEAGNLKRVFDKDTGSNFATGLTYNELNQIHTLEFGNGVKTRMNYDVGQGSYRLTDILTYTGASIGDATPVDVACASSSAIQCLGYQYDKVSNITAISDFVAMRGARTAQVRDFGYDDLHQLTHAEGPWGIQDFTYDEIGNITSKSSVSPLTRSGIGWVDRLSRRAKAMLPSARTTQAYSYHSTRKQILTAVGGTNYSFDPYGNLDLIGSTQDFSFDAMNHLVSFNDGSGVMNHFYDEAGDRVEKKSGSSSTFYASRYFEKRGSSTYRYIFAGTRRIALVPDAVANVQYVHGDHLGSSNYITDGAATVGLHREFAPYGELVSETGSTTQLKHGFTDKYLDAESGLNYFGARYYLPGVGRWASADPLFASETFAPDTSSSSKNVRLNGISSHMVSADYSSDQVEGFGLNRKGTSPSALFQSNSGPRQIGKSWTSFRPAEGLYYDYVGSNPLRFTDPSGLSRLEFDRGSESLFMYPGDSAAVQGPPERFDASNNAKNPGADPWTPEGNGPIPEGTFRLGKLVETGEGKNSPSGTAKIPVYLPATEQGVRVGVQLHAGKAESQKGFRSTTLGCVRTTEEALGAFRRDPPTVISILPSPASQSVLP